MFLVLDGVIFVAERFSKLLAQLAICRPVVGDDCCAWKNVTSNERINCFLGAISNSKRESRSALPTFNNAEYPPLGCILLWLALMMLCAQVSSISMYLPDPPSCC